MTIKETIKITIEHMLMFKPPGTELKSIYLGYKEIDSLDDDPGKQTESIHGLKIYRVNENSHFFIPPIEKSNK